MSRNLLYAIARFLAWPSWFWAIMVYEDRQKAKGVEIKIDDSGISIQGN